MRRLARWIWVPLALPTAVLLAAPDEPKTLPDAAPAEPADRHAAPESPAEPGRGASPERNRGASPAVREALKKVEDLLRAREGRLLEQVKKIVDEELSRLAEERRKREAERKALADRAGSRLKAIEQRIEALKGSLDGAIARARKALGEAPEKTEPAEAETEEAAAPARPPVPEPYRKLVQAIRLHESGEYEKAIAGFAEAIQGLEKMNTAEARRYRAEALYYTACSHAILGHADPAFRHLEQAVRAGYRNLEKIENDAELDPIREDPRFERLYRYARSLKG